MCSAHVLIFRKSYVIYIAYYVRGIPQNQIHAVCWTEKFTDERQRNVIYPARMLQPEVSEWISGSAHNLFFEFWQPRYRYLVLSCACRGRKTHWMRSKCNLWPQSIRLLLHRIIEIRNYFFSTYFHTHWSRQKTAIGRNSISTIWYSLYGFHETDVRITAFPYM